MIIVVNGEKREISEELTLAALLRKLELPSERVAIELNQTVVRRTDWERTVVKDGDKLEIVHFVGGGSD